MVVRSQGPGTVPGYFTYAHQLYFCSMTGANFIAIFAQKQAAFFSPDLVPDSRFVELVLLVSYMLQTSIGPFKTVGFRCSVAVGVTD